MKVTVTQLPDNREAFALQWEKLVEYTQVNQPDFVLLPELIFSRWLFDQVNAQPALWEAAVTEHEAWLTRLGELGAACVAGTLPTAKQTNTGFMWNRESEKVTHAHDKAYLPNEKTCWERNWYTAGATTFKPSICSSVTVGFLICTELWFADAARAYAEIGAHLLLAPRGTERASVNKWIIGGQAAAISGGAYCLSANRSGKSAAGTDFGGAGWVIDPDGDVLAVTSDEAPFVTVELDLNRAEQAKSTYPRNVYLAG